MVHARDLTDWLYVLLTRLLNKTGTDMLGSVNAKLLRTLDTVRSVGEAFQFVWGFGGPANRIEEAWRGKGRERESAVNALIGQSVRGRADLFLMLSAIQSVRAHNVCCFGRGVASEREREKLHLVYV